MFGDHVSSTQFHALWRLSKLFSFRRSFQAAGEELFKLVQEAGLALREFLLGRVEREPRCSIDFGELLLSARARRPFHRESVAPRRFGIHITLYSPYGNDLSARLFHGAKWNKFPLNGHTRFFGEFAPGSVERVFARWVLTFRNRPGPLVFPCPERSTRVDEKYLQSFRPLSKQQNTGTDFHRKFPPVTQLTQPKS